MCIRDRVKVAGEDLVAHPDRLRGRIGFLTHSPYLYGDLTAEENLQLYADLYGCLLYTSDAADERSSVDLGGRRIIKKKKNNEHLSAEQSIKTTSKPTDTSIIINRYR